MPDRFDIPEIPIRGIDLRKLIPDSPFLRIGNEIRLRVEWARFTRALPTTPDAADTKTDRKET